MLFDIFSKDGFIQFLYILPALVISIVIHEFSHAFVAYKLGDRSQKATGRLSLDPFVHLDPLGFISIMLLNFGWGKPVYVNDTNFKNKSRDNMLVALAGPLSNLLLAVIFTLILKVMLMTGFIVDISELGKKAILLNVIILTIEFNVIFSVFNMIPIPPFDGGKVLEHFLPYKYKGIMYKLEQYSLIILLVLFVTKLGAIIISPIVNFISRILYFIIGL